MYEQQTLGYCPEGIFGSGGSVWLAQSRQGGFWDREQWCRERDDQKMGGEASGISSGKVRYIEIFTFPTLSFFLGPSIMSALNGYGEMSGEIH